MPLTGMFATVVLAFGADDAVGTKAASETAQVTAESPPDSSSSEAPRPMSIIEQRRAAMRGDAMGRKEVEVRKSSKADLIKGDITFDDLKFDIEKGQAFDRKQLSETIRFLNGRQVKLRGYILPSTLYKETNIDEFVLVRDNQECCFGPGAALFDCVMIKMEPGKTTDFVTYPVSVEGRFVLDDQSYAYPGGKGPDGGSHLAVFRIEGIRVR